MEEEPIDIEEEEFNIIDFILEYKYFFIAGGVTVVVLVGIILIKQEEKKIKVYYNGMKDS